MPPDKTVRTVRVPTDRVRSLPLRRSKSFATCLARSRRIRPRIEPAKNGGSLRGTKIPRSRSTDFVGLSGPSGIFTVRLKLLKSHEPVNNIFVARLFGPFSQNGAEISLLRIPRKHFF
jgi:hypothetical protein